MIRVTKINNKILLDPIIFIIDFFSSLSWINKLCSFILNLFIIINSFMTVEVNIKHIIIKNNFNDHLNFSLDEILAIYINIIISPLLNVINKIIEFQEFLVNRFINKLVEIDWIINVVPRLMGWFINIDIILLRINLTWINLIQLEI